MGFLWINTFYYFGIAGSSNWNRRECFGCFCIECGRISLSLSIKVHCLAGKLLNSSPLSPKFEINLLLRNSRGMQDIFLLLGNIFKSGQ